MPRNHSQGVTVQWKKPLPIRKRGQYAVFSGDGACVAQGRRADTALAKARRAGVATPILVDLDVMEKRTYIL